MTRLSWRSPLYLFVLLLLSAVCEKVGADVREVSRAIGADPRLGSKFLQASVGFGGSCFQKDVLDLVYLSESYGLTEVANYWKQVVLMNDYQKERFARRVIHDMFETVAGKRIAMFGYAFKKDTGDTRETAAAYVSKYLLQEQAHIVVFDPKTSETSMYMELDYSCGINEATMPSLKKDMVMVKDPYEAAKGAHAILVMTEWDMFKELDYVAETMKGRTLDTVYFGGGTPTALKAEELDAILRRANGEG